MIQQVMIFASVVIEKLKKFIIILKATLTSLVVMELDTVYIFKQLNI